MIHLQRTRLRRCLSGLAVVATFAVATCVGFVWPAEPPVPAAKPAPRTDREGFPLPDEALARVGSAKLRHGANLEHLEYSPDGRLLVSSGSGLVRVWDARTGSLLRDIAVKQDGMSVGGTFAADGKSVVVRDGQTCRWIDARTGEDVRGCDIKLPRVHGTICMAPRGEMIAVADRLPGSDLVVYELPSGRERVRKSAAGMWPFPAMTFSADGRRFAACDFAGRRARRMESRVRVFDTTTGGALTEFDADTMRCSLVFSPDDKLLAVGASVEHVDIRSVADGKVVSKVHHDMALGTTIAAFGANSTWVLIGRAQHVVQTEIGTQKELRRFSVGKDSTCLALTPDGKGLAIGTDDGAISQWSLATGERQIPSADPITVSGPMRFSSDRVLELWAAGLLAMEWQTGRELRRIPLPLHDVVVAPDGSRVAAVNNHYRATVAPDGSRSPVDFDFGVTVWDGSTGKKVVTLSHCLGELAAFSPDGRKLYTSDTGEIRAWDAKTGKRLEQLRDGRKQFREGGKLEITQHLATSPDGRRLAAAARIMDKAVFPFDTEITIWDVAGGKEPRKPLRTRLSVAAIAFSPDGNYLAAVGGPYIPEPGRDGRFLELWDVRSGEPKPIQSVLKDHCTCIAFSPDGRVLAAGDGTGAIVLWELATGRERHRFVGTRSAVAKVVFSPDSKLLASASPDAPVYVWDVDGCHGKPASAEPFSAESAETLWAALEDADASVAFTAMRELFARPGSAVSLLRERLRPAAGVDDKSVRGWLRDLDSDTFAVREKAAADLQAAVDSAEPLLRAALKEKPSAETKRRIESILESAATGAPDRRRSVRAVEVAEQLATAEARELLKSWSDGAESMLLTGEARAAIARLKAR